MPLIVGHGRKTVVLRIDLGASDWLVGEAVRYGAADRPRLIGLRFLARGLPSACEPYQAQDCKDYDLGPLPKGT